MFKNLKCNAADKAIAKSANFKIDFSKEVFVEDFDTLRIFLQPEKFVPAPSGAECMICTVTISSNNPVLELLGGGKNNQRVILVGKAFMKLPHVKKLVLLQAEAYRTNQKITNNLRRPAGISSSTLDREIATRQALATEFKPRVVEKTLGHRDQVVVHSTTKVNKGIYAESKETHYKAPKHPIFHNGKKSRYTVTTGVVTGVTTEDIIPDTPETGSEPITEPA